MEDRLAFEVELSDGAELSDAAEGDQFEPTSWKTEPKAPAAPQPQAHVPVAEPGKKSEEDSTTSVRPPAKEPVHSTPEIALPNNRTEPNRATSGPNPAATPEVPEKPEVHRMMESKLVDPARPQPGLSRVQVRLEGSTENVRVELTQVAGNVRVAVRSVDDGLVRDLQAGLPEVIAGIEDSGIQVQALVPDSGAPIARDRQSTISENMQGNLEWSQSGQSDSSGNPSGRHPRQRKPEQQWQEWLEER
jgi:hypothetical protein